MTTYYDHSANMLCSCGKPAIVHVGDKGFCKDHREDAVKANKLDAAHVRAQSMIWFKRK